MNTLDELRNRYKKASSDEERQAIILEANRLKGDLYQCYFEENGVRCKNYQKDCWCSEEHRIAWQDTNYIDKRLKGEKQLSIFDMQKRLREMGINKKKKRFEKQSKLL